MVYNKRYEEAEKHFAEMKQNKLTNDTQLYNSMLNCYAKQNKIVDFFRFLEEMKRIGIKKTIVTINIILDFLGKRRDLLTLEEEWKKLITNGKSSSLHPNQISFNIMINAFASANRLSDVLEKFEEMKKLNIKPNLQTYTPILSLVAKRGDFQSINKLCEDMQDEGIEADTYVHSVIIRAHCEAFNWDESRYFPLSFLDCLHILCKKN
jgi:pentatricopeptide repeat domain-containing protein 1